MKVGIFTEVYKPIINGVVNSIIETKQGLEKMGHDVYIFCPTYKQKAEKNVIYCKSTALPGKSGYHFIWPLDEKVKSIAREMDLIHVHHPFIMGDRAADVAEELDKPLVFTNHTQYDQYLHYIPISKKFVKKKLIDYIRSFTKRVDLIVAPAAGIQRKLESYGVKTDIRIVPNGIDVDHFSKKSTESELKLLRKKYNIKNDEKVLIFTGRIADEKNLEFLLKAFKKISERIKNLKLVMVGGGVAIDKYNKMIDDIELKDKAIITDFIPYAQMSMFLDLAYIYVTASKSEVHPLTVLEGMASGLPMVIVDAPGTGDIVTDNIDGLVSEDNIDDYVKKTIKLLNDEKLYERLQKDAIKTSKEYSFDAMSKIMYKAYQKAIKNHKEKK